MVSWCCEFLMPATFCPRGRTPFSPSKFIKRTKTTLPGKARKPWGKPWGKPWEDLQSGVYQWPKPGTIGFMNDNDPLGHPEWLRSTESTTWRIWMNLDEYGWLWWWTALPGLIPRGHVFWVDKAPPFWKRLRAHNLGSSWSKKLSNSRHEDPKLFVLKNSKHLTLKKQYPNWTLVSYQNSRHGKQHLDSDRCPASSCLLHHRIPFYSISVCSKSDIFREIPCQ